MCKYVSVLQIAQHKPTEQKQQNTENTIWTM